MSAPRKPLVASLLVALCLASPFVGCGDDPIAPISDASDAAESSADVTSHDTSDTPDSLVDASLDASVDAQPNYTGAHVWSKRFGENASSALQGTGIGTDATGNVFVVGGFQGDVNFGGGLLSSAGSSDVYLAKFNKDGTHQWSKRFGDSDVQGSSLIVVDSSGSVVIAGNFDGTVDFGGGALTSKGGFDVFVAKFDSAGNHLWSKSFGDAQYQAVTGIATTGADIVIVGEFAGTIELGGAPLTAPGFNYLAKLSGASGGHIWSSKSITGDFTPRGPAVDHAGNLILVGGLDTPVDWGKGVLTSAGQTDVLVLKFDTTGAAVWTKRYGGTGAQGARFVAVDSNDRIVLGGGFSGSLDFGGGATATTADNGAYVAVLDVGGNGVWCRPVTVPSPSTVLLSTGAVDAFDNIVVAGNASRSLDFGGGPLPATATVPNIVIAKLSPAGTHRWSKGWASGSTGSNGAHAATFDLAGSLLFASTLNTSTIDMGGGPLTAVGADMILAKLAP